MLWPIVVIGAIIFVVMLLIRNGRTPAEPSNRTGLRSLEILRERFARGEIDQAEYEERRRVILLG